MGKDISIYRSIVIEKSINIEMLINFIISQKYIGKCKKDFLFDVLYDPCFTFGLKINILEKIKPSVKELENELKNLRRLNNIRNLFDHCNSSYHDGERTFIPHPKNIDNEIDFRLLYNEFCQIEPNINKVLLEWFDFLNGKILK